MAMRPQSCFDAVGVSPGALVHPTARIEHGASIDPGAVVGPHVEIGAGTVVCANAVIGPHCRIGRNCSISAGVTLVNALVGNRVILHPGVRIGAEDGSASGHGPARASQGAARSDPAWWMFSRTTSEIGAGQQRRSTVARAATR